VCISAKIRQAAKLQTTISGKKH